MFLKEELAVTIIMDTRTTKAVEYRAKFKINQHDPILTKEQSTGLKIVKAFPNKKTKETKGQSIGLKIVKAFSNKKIKEKFFVLNEKIEFYFPRHKLAIEVDELGHLERNEEDEIKIQKKL